MSYITYPPQLIIEHGHDKYNQNHELYISISVTP